DYFQKEYIAGRTPNPCVICNHQIKFGLLPSLVRSLHNCDFDYFATGHYARIEFDPIIQRYLLKKGVNSHKDQSYFLYRLSQEQLATTLFPLGAFEKTTVRSIAAQAGLPVHDKVESQDFYSGDYTDLISGNRTPGEIVDTAGTVLGIHNGIMNFTIGQRKGLGIAIGRPLYVVGLDSNKNRVIVGDKKFLENHGLKATQLNIITDHIPQQASVKIRSTASAVACRCWIDKEQSPATLTVEFEQPQSAVTPGQSAVVYDGDTVCGGGFIESGF
ncbi:MAG: tRNA 2-thiouridine(34) synthase MnmA, partial [Chitinivibrionales bacterium]|nr:tRNA 2-thiouridine(34) synthase MnmA [Chitinivibrionales bacterium]